MTRGRPVVGGDFWTEELEAVIRSHHQERVMPLRFSNFSRATVIVMAIAASATSSRAQDQLGIFAAQTDVGPTQHRGSTLYDSERQTSAIAGSGDNMWNERDEFHFVWKRMTGNFILSARGRFASKGVEAHRK